MMHKNVRDRFSAETCVGLVVDVQERLVPHIDNGPAVVGRIALLIEGLTLLQVPVLLTEQYPKGLGRTVGEISAKIGESPVLEKTEFSCAANRTVNDALSQYSNRVLVIAGIEAHVCIQQTVVDTLRHGRPVVVCADAVSSRRAFDRDVAIQHMRHEGATVTTVESLLFELCHISGTDRFRQLSKLVKEGL